MVKSAAEKFLKEFEFIEEDDFLIFSKFVDELEKMIGGDKNE